MPNGKALVLGSFALLAASSGCVTPGKVWLYPDGSPGPEECPDEAKKAMRYMDVHVGDRSALYIDANQSENEFTVLHGGPIESILLEGFGPLRGASRLYGQVWIGGPQVVIRYYAAQAPSGEKVPFCAVARFGGDQMKKLPDSKPGSAKLLGSTAYAYVVDAFR